MKFLISSPILIYFLLLYCSFCSVQKLSFPSSARSNPSPLVAGVIITFKNGHSYDSLFTSVPQQSKEGTVVLTYAADISAQQSILKSLRGDIRDQDQILKQISRNIQTLAKSCPSCVVINWECSSGFSSKKFYKRGEYTFQILKIVRRQGYLAMFSDFSLKALISQWKQSVLGPNPFVQVGETSGEIQLKFNKQKLLESPSAQLQAVAQLSRDERVTIHTLGSTIVYNIRPTAIITPQYNMQVLTFHSYSPRAPYNGLRIQKIDESREETLPGHVLIKYPGGGSILTSMGHWIQLMKIETSREKLFDVAKKLFGEQQYTQINREYNSLKTEGEQKKFIQEKSKFYVQNQSPGANANTLKKI